MTTSKKACITGIASYLPDRVLTNADLEKMVQTSDEWIVSRTGMKERRIAARDECPSDMGAKAANKLLESLGRSAEEIEFIIVATMTPDSLSPSTSTLLQAKIGAVNAAAMDIQAACTGFIYGLSIAKAFIESGIYKNILVVASEKVSSFVDYTDRNTCVLFGDGASAAWIEASREGLCIESISLGADGEQAHLGVIPAGGSRKPATLETVKGHEHYVKMEGKELFKHAVRRMAAAAQTCLKKANLKESDISWVVPHQANIRIIDAVGKTFSIKEDRIYKTVHKYGNTSASSISIALNELLNEHELVQGELILLAAFGFGLTWGAAVLKKI